jgi:RNA polymerase sigma factor (sigma-70 family)
MDNLEQQLATYAYNITGSHEEAEDIVQDVLLQVMKVPEETIQNKKAYLTRSVINRAINVKKRQQRTVHEYPGRWLPEPVATETADGRLHQEDILSYSLLVLLEKLNARQRAVFILKEAFDYEHEEIAEVLDISVENSRKLLSRAKKELQDHSTRDFKKAPDGYLDKYLQVIQNRDIAELEKLLAEEVVVLADGGGKATAYRKPVIGRKPVSALLFGTYKKSYLYARIEKGMVNHQPALFYFVEEVLINCQVFTIENGVITQIYNMRNPDKLQLLSQSI